jgi:hypothetical protein
MLTLAFWRLLPWGFFSLISLPFKCFLDHLHTEKFTSLSNPVCLLENSNKKRNLGPKLPHFFRLMATLSQTCYSCIEWCWQQKICRDSQTSFPTDFISFHYAAKHLSLAIQSPWGFFKTPHQNFATLHLFRISCPCLF